jgi:hypothetical protein
MKEAREEFEEALETYRELVQKNPEAYLPYVRSGCAPQPGKS